MRHKETESTLTSSEIVNGTMINTEWLTRLQASKYLQCSLCSLDTRYDIKKYYLNKSVRYFKRDLDAYLLAHCKEPVKGRKDDVQ